MRRGANGGFLPCEAGEVAPRSGDGGGKANETS